MSFRPSRRDFLQTSAAAGIGFWVAGGVAAAESDSPNERVALASIGVGNRGGADSAEAGNLGDMVAICDVDQRMLDAAARRFPKAKQYRDFRVMFEEMGKDIDAVTVSTADHMHAAAALMAMRMGKHCFCQKPLTRTIYEARVMAKVAAETKVATQMGNQGTANSTLRQAAAALRAGVVGNVKEVHVWTNRPIWPQGMTERPKTTEVPSWVDWDLWLGVAPKRPYAAGYHPFKWRGWWDFGSGALGDMACHTVNMPYMGLDLKNPTAVQAETSGHNRDAYPSWSVIEYDYPANSWRPGLKLFWYDGGKKPPAELSDKLNSLYEEERKNPKYLRGGCIAVGDKGTLYAPGDYAEHTIKLNEGEPLGSHEFVRSPGHMKEWFIAMKGGPEAKSNFANYAGGLTETLLLGNLAVYAANEPGARGPKVQWDAVNLMPTNMPELMTLVKPTYPKGWVLDV